MSDHGTIKDKGAQISEFSRNVTKNFTRVNSKFYNKN